MRRVTRTMDLPKFPEDLEWLNTERPLKLADLSGKAVLLNFFTSCCINCTHVVADLKRLHARYAPELLVIGVHSPKLSAEREANAVRDAILRLGIDYAVVNDRDMRIWKQHEVRAWPTTMLVAPHGRIIETRVGEGIFDALDGTIGAVLSGAIRTGDVDHAPLPLRAEGEQAPAQPLSFPGSVLADESSERLFISDTGNNRVIIADLDGTVLDVVGRGSAGREDGAFDRATFRSPRGLALDGSMLYVADQGNHSIRRLDLDLRVVQRIAGTGHQAPALVEPGSALKTDLNSPWDLQLIHHRLYMTMAGAHQIWRLDLQAEALEAYAGGSVAGLVDGTRLDCLLAQPSGLTSDGVRLFLTDAASSALRWVYLPPGRQLGTWIGRGLFQYGDVDGKAGDALLQHPIGLTHHDGLIYVADTHNNKVKVFNPRPARILTLFGTGERGHRDGEPGALNGPSDVSCVGGRMWIADTNNHAIRVASINGGAMETLELHPAERLEPPGT